MDQTHWSTVKHCEAWQRDQTHWSNNEIDNEALWWIKPIDRRWSTVKLDREIEPIDQTTRSTVKHWDGSNPLIEQRNRRWDRTHWSTMKHCEAWQRDRTHWSNYETDSEASSKTGQTAKHCYGSMVKLAAKARQTAKHYGGSMEVVGLRDWRIGEKEVRVKAENERLRWGERNK